MSTALNKQPQLGPQRLPMHAASQTKGLEMERRLQALFPDCVNEAVDALLTTLPVPHRRLERWKYAAVNGFWAECARSQTQTLAATALDPLPVPGLDAYRLVFVNGCFDAASSSLPVAEGVTCMPLSDAEANGHEKRILTDMERTDWFAVLNGKYATDGVFLSIKDGVALDRPLVIHQRQEGVGNPTFLRHSIHLGKHAEASVVVWSSSSDDASGFVNTLTTGVVGEGATLRLDKVQDEAGTVHHLAMESIDQAASSHFRIQTATIQGLWVRNDLAIALNGAGADAVLNGAFLPNKSEMVDNHTTVDHRMPHCTSSESYKGILYDKSKGVFNGKVFVRPDAQQTNAYQQNANILASREAVMNAKPELEIYADDVKCSHGCTIGQFDDDALFYAQSRGIGEAEAKSMLVHAFITDILDGFAVEEVALEVRHRLAEKHNWNRWDDPSDH